jgi:hypothetical protein
LVLRNSGASLEDLAGRLSTTSADLEEELERLCALGLVTVQSGEPPTVVAGSPEERLNRLIADETRRVSRAAERLRLLHGVLPELTADYLASRAPAGEPVTIEVIDGGDLLGLLESLAATSTGDLLWLRPDQFLMPIGPAVDALVMGLVRAGRASRAIYPARALAVAPDVVRARAEAGEHVRILASLPARMAILGENAVLVPEGWAVDDGRRLLLRQPALVAAHRLLFETLWERAMPVPGLSGVPGEVAGAWRIERRLLLDLLAAGKRDEQIARELALSLRTVRRRVAAIMQELGADSRFQAGVEAVRRGRI